MRTWILAIVFAGIQPRLQAQPPANKPNIPVLAIANQAYRDAPVGITQVFFDRGSERYLFDLTPGVKDSFVVRELKGDYRWGDTARKYGTVFRFGVSLLNIEPDKLQLRLSLFRYEGKDYNEERPLGLFYDERDIACEYDFFARKWKYVKTIKVGDH